MENLWFHISNDWISEVSKSLVPTVGYCMTMHKGLIYWYFRYVLGSINSHYFHIIGDGHQPNSRRLYTHSKDSPEEGGMSLSPIEGVEKDPGTYDLKNPHASCFGKDHLKGSILQEVEIRWEVVVVPGTLWRLDLDLWTMQFPYPMTTWKWVGKSLEIYFFRLSSRTIIQLSSVNQKYWSMFS